MNVAINGKTVHLPGWTDLKNLFVDRLKPKQRERGYREILGVGSSNTDWNISMIGEDSDVWQNAWLLCSRMRDLFRTNPVMIKAREMLLANVYGENGIMLRMKVKETEDRVVNTPDEKWALIEYERRINRLRTWAEKNLGKSIEQYRAYKLADAMDRSNADDILTRKATIQVGDPDIFANLLIERRWAEWQRSEFCDMRGKRNYHSLRQLRFINGFRDGDMFIRVIRNGAPTQKNPLNKFGLTLQLISAEWCDRFYNTVLPNGNVVIMGIEYEMTDWGIGKPVAYYFIRRQPRDWQFSVPASFNFTTGNLHVRIGADEIIHYARPVDVDSTRPAPWAAAIIPKARQLDQYELAEVIAAREQACKTGFYTSTVLPEGGFAQTAGLEIPDPKRCQTEAAAPGETIPLEWGVDYKERNPTHPNGNFENFRKGMGQSISAGIPGGDYNVLFNDLSNINFSAGRLGRLDTNETSKMIQRFDIDVAERPIFETWLEMSLITGAIQLPLVKLEKFNKPVFQGRRWAQVDEVKAINAAALRIANKLSSRSRECAEEGIDFEDNAFELAEEEMLLEELGLESKTTVEGNTSPVDATDTATEGADEGTNAPAGGTNKPSPVKKPAKSQNGNGHSSESLERITVVPITIGKKIKTTRLVRDENNRITGTTQTEESDD